MEHLTFFAALNYFCPIFTQKKNRKIEHLTDKLTTKRKQKQIKDSSCLLKLFSLVVCDSFYHTKYEIVALKCPLKVIFTMQYI